MLRMSWPGGPMEISRWRQPPENHPNGIRPEGAAELCSPQIPLIVFHAAALQEFEIFLLKCPPPMMFFLPGDVFADGLALRCADSERAVAFLPREGVLAGFLMHPARGNGFHIAHHIREAGRRAQADEEMHMVRDASDGFGHAFDVSRYTAEVGVQPFTPHGGDAGCAVFGAKDDVVMEREVGGWHGWRGSGAPAGARSFFTSNPVADATG